MLKKILVDIHRMTSPRCKRALLLQSKFSSHAAPGSTLALFNSVSTALPAQPYVSKTERYPRGPQIKCSASFHSLSVSVSVFSLNFYLPYFHYLLSFLLLIPYMLLLENGVQLPDAPGDHRLVYKKDSHCLVKANSKSVKITVLVGLPKAKQTGPYSKTPNFGPKLKISTATERGETLREHQNFFLKFEIMT